MNTEFELNTKSKLLKAAITVFSNHGYTGGSVRQIAQLAETNIAAIKYHYSSKEHLWRAVVSHLHEKLVNTVLQDEALWPDMTPKERVVNTTKLYVRFSACHPELHRIILFETIHRGERLKWLVDNHMSRFTDSSIAWMTLAQEEGVFPNDVSALHLHFITTAAAQMIFLMAPQIEHSYGIDVFEDSEVDQHIDAILKLFMGVPRPGPNQGDHPANKDTKRTLTSK